MKTACASIGLCAIVGAASASTFDFSAYTNNSGSTGGIAATATLAADATTFSVTVANASPQGFIGSFYIETGAALAGVDASSVEFGNTADVRFKLANGVWSGPGGDMSALTDTAWAGSFIEITKDGAASNGIQSGESFTMTFAHDGSFDLAGLASALDAGTLRLGLHYQGWLNGQSEKLINDNGNSTLVVVPLPPAAFAGFGMIGTLAGVRAYRRLKRG